MARQPVLDRDQHHYKDEKHPGTAGDELDDDQGEDQRRQDQQPRSPRLRTLAGAGLRVGEAVTLDWRHVNLATGTLTVDQAKTDAGSYREVDLPGGLIEALSEWKASREHTAPADPVLSTRSGSRQTVTNIDHRMKAAIKAANVKLEELGIEPISDRVSPHSLRRTYASIRAAAGDNPIYIAEQLGHEDPAFTFRVYQQAVKRRDRLEGNYLEAFDRALEWAAMGAIVPADSGSERAASHQISE